jgi:integrase
MPWTRWARACSAAKRTATAFWSECSRIAACVGGEASGLRVKDVDFKRGRLEVQHTIVEVDGFQIDSEPKDYEARSIPVPASLLADLAVLPRDVG